MELVQFYINNKQFNEAILKLGSKKNFYSFAKNAFLSKLKEVKDLKKEVWYECHDCSKEFREFVQAEIEKNTGRIIPVCNCGRGLVRRVKKFAN